MIAKSGEVRWVRTQASPIMKENIFERARGTLIDITEHKREEAVRVRLATAVEQAAEAVVITDTNANIQYVNPAFERISGYTRDVALGKNPRILKSGQHDQAFYENLWKTLSRGETWAGRFVNKRKDGSIYHEDSTISPVRDSSGKIVNYVAVKRDITQELQLEQQLRQAQKMEAVGTLAGGVAHDFNNLLQVVLGYSEFVLTDESLNDSARDDVKKIHQAATNGAELVRGLLTFGRKTEIQPRYLNLNHQIERVRKLLSRTIPKMIEVKTVLAPDVAAINADPSQVEQILMNLAVNARDAMPEGGTLTIETQNVEIEEDYYKAHLGAKLGRNVLLTVSDTGIGMNRETVEHIFEPFYTTKRPGEGTGLGLAIVYGIVRQHDGHIFCYSEQGIGTTFKIYIPAVTSDPGTVEIAQHAMARGGNETILIVDDEELVRGLGERLLANAGYTVLTASNGREALEVFQRDRERIALVILDLIMPEMGGRQCLEELLKLDPKAKVVVASGYSADGRSGETALIGAKGFMSKPYDMRHVLQVVRDVLDAR